MRTPDTVLAHLGDELLDARGFCNSEGSGRFVEDEQAWLPEQRPRDRDQLLLATGQRSRRLIRADRARADPAQRGHGGGTPRARREEHSAFPAQHDVARDIEFLAHSIVLPQHLDAGRPHALRGRRHPSTVEADLSRVEFDHAADARHERRLARTRLADECDDLTFVHAH